MLTGTRFPVICNFCHSQYVSDVATEGIQDDHQSCYDHICINLSSKSGGGTQLEESE